MKFCEKSNGSGEGHAVVVKILCYLSTESRVAQRSHPSRPSQNRTEIGSGMYGNRGNRIRHALLH